MYVRKSFFSLLARYLIQNDCITEIGTTNAESVDPRIKIPDNLGEYGERL